jgi:hypothetical protein
MRKALTIVLLTLGAAGTAFADPQGLPPWKHLLALSPGAITLMNDSIDRSAIVEGLIRKVEESGVVVYLTDAMPAANAGPLSYLTYLSNEGDLRYLLVRIDRWRTSPVERIALLGHELQHALEVASAPEVRDARGMARLYRRIGWESRPDKFETDAAQSIGNRVRSEVASGQDRKRAAVVAVNP